MDDEIDGSYLAVTPDFVVDENTNIDSYLEMTADTAKEDAGYLAVSQDWLSEQWELMAEQPWFRGDQNRHDAKKELMNKPAGTFVVRVSQSEPGHFALSAVQDGGHMDHMLVLPSYAGPDANAPGATRYRLGTYSKNLFNTVPKLVAYYIGHPYIDNSYLKGVVLAEKQEGGYLPLMPDDEDSSYRDIAPDDPSQPQEEQGYLGVEPADDYE